MNDSQCLDDLPVVSRWTAAAKREVGVRDFYSESQRLALEELVAGGREAYLAFLHREKMPGFLSAAEIADILGSAVRPSESCNESLDQSFSGSQGQSTGTYFPDASDIEVPDLDLGWPVFPHNWYRGVTQVEVYFQPSYGELIYSCKEAIRNLIRKAEKKMRVRTLKGCTYYTRTGAKVIGRVHEKFMLIDCEKVATGSYSFTWTDGKLNRSNLTVLSGQLSEFYDEEFRILYAQSEPIPLKHTDYGNRAIYEEFTMKRLLSKDPTVANTLRQGIVECSPNKRKPAEKRPRPQSSVSSTDQCVCEASAPADNAPPINEEVKSVSTQTELEWLSETTVNGASTQTCILMKEMETQTSFFSKSSTAQTSAGTGIIQRAQIIASVPETSTEVTKGESTDLGNLPPASTAESTNSSSTSSGTTVSESQPCSKAVRYPRVDLRCADSSLKNYFQKLTKERQLHYSVIRSKLNNMVAILSRNQHLSVIHSRGPGQYNVRDKRELMSRSRVFGFRDAPMLASLALRN
ncbi:protein FAM83D-B-like isoform X3 [Pristis pectinata]|uniref:protein FAM83D-B-like isoform X3 n=1 Tax=Pristis pectinata TaxID=685728 RepID=UPI00223CF4A3|nr:protein FAM83D-B-like isoform X3 [Pristis pectinata]